MKIGVISDTHIPRAASRLPDVVLNTFKDVDMILHAGDLVEMPVLGELTKLAETHAVYGNMDSSEVVKNLPQKKIIGIGKFRIGLTHGYGSPFNLAKRVRGEFTEKVDVVVFGHSHSPMNEVRDGILFFNPGSPTDKIFARYTSYGILAINDAIKGEIIRIR